MEKELIVNTVVVCKRLQRRIYVLTRNVFLLIPNALACHLLQCSAHAVFFMFRKVEPRQTGP